MKRFDQPIDDAARLASIAGLAVLAVLVHELCFTYGIDLSVAQIERLGPVGQVLLALFGLTTLRYLVLIALATKDQFRVIAEHRLSKPEDYPSISVIVPVFNEGVTIRESLASLLQVDYPRLEIIVVDDGSKDQTYLHAYRAQSQAASSG